MRKERQDRRPTLRHGDEIHGDSRLGQQQSGFEHGGARRNVLTADLAAHLMKEGHGAPVGEELIASN